MLLAGQQLVSLFASKRYLASIIRKLYHIRNMPDLSLIRKCDQTNDKKYLCCCTTKHDVQHDYSETANSLNMWRYIESQRHLFVTRSLKTNNKMTEKVREHLVNSVVNRNEFIYTLKDLI